MAEDGTRWEFIPTPRETDLMRPLLSEQHAVVRRLIDRVDRQELPAEDVDPSGTLIMLTGLACGAFQTVVRARGLDPDLFAMRSPLDDRFLVEARQITLTSRPRG